MTEPPVVRSLDSSEISEEIERTRARLSRCMAALDREYALRNLFVHTIRAVRDSETHPTDLARAVRREAVPLALIGIGAAWIAFRRGEGTALLRRLAVALDVVRDLAGHLVAASKGARTPP